VPAAPSDSFKRNLSETGYYSDKRLFGGAIHHRRAHRMTFPRAVFKHLLIIEQKSII